MIVGSGSGNDVAAAIRSDIKEIDAVEIDPVIAELGKNFIQKTHTTLKM